MWKEKISHACQIILPVLTACAPYRRKKEQAVVIPDQPK